jgi:beta-mannosidase
MDLAGTWTLQSADGAHRASLMVPGDVHSALIAAGVIPHPYNGRNEYAVRWVAETDWTIERSFDWQGPEGNWYLDIDYLDTVAEVFVNGESVLKAANCFRRYRPDVTKHLRKGQNSIVIRFASNVKEAAQPCGERIAQSRYPRYSHDGGTPRPLCDGRNRCRRAILRQCVRSTIR